MDGILVWDPQNSKSPLHCSDARFVGLTSLSFDGHLSACQSTGSNVYLWKESHTGYILCKELTPSFEYPCSLLSPNGELIAVVGDHMIQLWHTEGFTPSPSSNLTYVPQNARNFILDFYPDGVSAVVARQGDTVVMILSLKSGVSQHTINVGMVVCGLQLIGDTIAVVCNKKVMIWNLLSGDWIPNVRVPLEGCPWTRHLDKLPDWDYLTGVSVSPDLCHVALIYGFSMYTYSTFNGVCITHTQLPGKVPWFSPDGYNLWSVKENGKAYM